MEKDCSSLWHNHLEELHNLILTSSPVVYAFVYCEVEPDGIILKGFKDEVDFYIEETYAHAVAHLLLHRGNITHHRPEHKVWRGYGAVIVSPPRPSRNKTLIQDIGQVNYAVHINNSTFGYKRMPNKWLSSWTEALE